MDNLFTKANKKFIDHISTLNSLYNQFDDEIFDSSEFKANLKIGKGSKLEDVLMFLFTLGYELKEINPETVDDPTNGKIEELINKLDSLFEKCETDEQKQLYYFTSYLLHNYFILDEQSLWHAYAIEHNTFGPALREKIQVSFEHMRVSLLSISKVIDSPNAVFQYLKEAEYTNSLGLISSYLREGRSPDISAIYLFADQLDNEEWFKAFANIVFKEVQDEVNLLIKESQNSRSGINLEKDS